MAEPTTWWVDLLLKVGSPVVAVLGTWRLAISHKTTQENKLDVTFDNVTSLMPRVKILEDTSIRTDGRLGRIEESTKGTDTKIERIDGTTNQILGELRAQRHRND